MAKFETLFVGVDGEKVVDSRTTNEQIEKVRLCECLLDSPDGERITWDDLDNVNEPRTIFQSILVDRRMRVDKKTFMADRPSFCVITIVDRKAIRVEFYEGHDALSLVYDIRSKELQSAKLPNFMDHDPHGYDPAEFLKETFGIPKELSKPILDELHKVE
jgi:hypothetical protein